MPAACRRCRHGIGASKPAAVIYSSNSGEKASGSATRGPIPRTEPFEEGVLRNRNLQPSNSLSCVFQHASITFNTGVARCRMGHRRGGRRSSQASKALRACVRLRDDRAGSAAQDAAADVHCSAAAGSTGGATGSRCATAPPPSGKLPLYRPPACLTACLPARLLAPSTNTLGHWSCMWRRVCRQHGPPSPHTLRLAHGSGWCGEHHTGYALCLLAAQPAPGLRC